MYSHPRIILTQIVHSGTWRGYTPLSPHSHEPLVLGVKLAILVLEIYGIFSRTACHDLEGGTAFALEGVKYAVNMPKLPLFAAKLDLADLAIFDLVAGIDRAEISSEIHPCQNDCKYMVLRVPPSSPTVEMAISCTPDLEGYWPLEGAK